MFPPLLVFVFCVGLYLVFRGSWRLRKMGEPAQQIGPMHFLGTTKFNGDRATSGPYSALSASTLT